LFIFLRIKKEFKKKKTISDLKSDQVTLAKSKNKKVGYDFIFAKLGLKTSKKIRLFHFFYFSN
jgi:hypothetical protein